MTATGEAYAAMADQVFAFWSQVIQAVMPEPEKLQVKSWYVQPAPAKCGGADAWPMLPWMCMNPAAMASVQPSEASNDPFSMSDWMRAPFASWLELAKPQSAMAWPMALGMMSAGIPQTVAWPTARANIAAMDAFSIATNSVQAALENYRSGCARR